MVFLVALLDGVLVIVSPGGFKFYISMRGTKICYQILEAHFNRLVCITLYRYKNSLLLIVVIFGFTCAYINLN